MRLPWRLLVSSAWLEQPRELEELLNRVLAVVREADFRLQPRPHGIAIDDDAGLFLQLAYGGIEDRIRELPRDHAGGGQPPLVGERAELTLEPAG